MGRADSLEKTLMLGKIEGRKRREQQRMRWLDGITNLMDLSLSEQGSLWRCSSWGSRVRYDWATEQQITTMATGRFIDLMAGNRESYCFNTSIFYYVEEQDHLLIRNRKFSNISLLKDPEIFRAILCTHILWSLYFVSSCFCNLLGTPRVETQFIPWNSRYTFNKK